MKRVAIIVVLLAFVAAGCSQKAVTRPEGQQEQKKETTGTRNEANKITENKIPSDVESVGSKEGSSEMMKEQEDVFKDIHFDFDKYDVKETFRPVLKSIATWMTKNTDARLSVEGHCDDRGTNEYNLALGDRRAKAVRDALVALGVPPSRIDTISYGEEKPVCKEQTEECWARNRRAHFVVLTKAGK
ncbi:MAG: peptidoglycan-associated lipoprotein Pal [Nitrospiraceae bacterium]|nr:peptidoglycan-associated lipoprotein Pal [Nitrospiraceae bacterium]